MEDREDTVVVREFNSRADAEIVHELLVANGIEAFIVADDFGGVGPALQLTRGAQVVVAVKDQADAEAAIAASQVGGPLSEAEIPR
jgi:hypothetical protein